MRGVTTLTSYLSDWSGNDPAKSAVASAVRAVAEASADIAVRIARGPLEGQLGEKLGANEDGDSQTKLDVWANDRVIASLRDAPVALIASEELRQPLELQSDGLLAIAIDPLDGSSNIDTNVSIGTIFSVLPAAGQASFAQPGSAQLAAGYVIYGPQCALVLTMGEGTLLFTLDRDARQFRFTADRLAIAPDTNEYAINASNYRHWSDAVRSYIDDCLAGVEGPRGSDVNMRWIASLVAECHRILARGGVFLYPADARKGYEKGRLRLVYEANPIAFLIEQAGGKAFDGQTRILDIVPEAVHQRTPLIFGSAGEIDRIGRYKADPNSTFERSPLFARRGLLRA
ncbi:MULTISPECIES: class 1 fructose-bisphosphatase [Rhodomicrobium]|uniref:class 1 fructose-bisphosphatase n=1 Tax=Rhodomicrobium TaxID=1068 RepID=UPI000B4A9C23|nr:MULTISPECIES: class 1 fructose-bisphosphatase [Rhodomicrobium]